MADAIASGALPLNAAPATNVPTFVASAPHVRPGATLGAIAAGLRASYTISPHHNNVLVFPRRLHAIVVPNLHQMFYNLLRPIIFGNFRAYGARTPSDAADVALLNSICYTVSTEACAATHAVGYYKAMKIDSSVISAYGMVPSVQGTQFPTPVAALIESFGPYQVGDLFPNRMLNVPTISFGDIQQLRLNLPLYKAHYYQLFVDATSRSKTTALVTIDTNNITSSPWWTLHPNHARADNQVITSLNVFSPIPWEHLDTATTIAAFFIDELLTTRPGIAPFTVTKAYPFTNRVPRRPTDFPPEAMEYPYFDASQSTYSYVIENVYVQESDFYQNFLETCFIEQSSASTSAALSGKRKAASTHVWNDSVAIFRIKYFYFDHKTVNGISPSTRDLLATQLSH